MKEFDQGREEVDLEDISMEGLESALNCLDSIINDSDSVCNSSTSSYVEFSWLMNQELEKYEGKNFRL